MKRTCLAVLALGLAICPSARGAGAAPDEATTAQAIALAQQGDALWTKQDYQGALKSFQKAAGLFDAPTFRLRSAECLEKLGRLAAAVNLFQNVAATPLDAAAPAAFQRAVADAKREGDALWARTPKIVIAVRSQDPQQVRVSVDGQPVPPENWAKGWPVDPGGHEVSAASATRTVGAHVDAVVGSVAQVELSPDSAAQSAPVSSTSERGGGQPQRTWGWIGLGIGAAGITLGAATGGLALSKKGSLDSSCPARDQCPTNMSGDVDSYNTMRTLSTVGFAVGLVGAATGGVLLLTAPSPSPAPAPAPAQGVRVRPWLGLGSAGVVGRF